VRFTISILNTGESYACSATQNLLAGMEALARKGIPAGCRGGGCGVCKVQVESGPVRAAKMSRACISAEEERQGLVLACRAYPQGDLKLRAVDRLARCVERSLERQAPSFLEAARASAPPAAVSSTPAPTTGDTSWH
jgi:ferredoxin